MAFVIPNAKNTFLDINGVPLAGGSVFSYVVGTTQPTPTYTDATLTVANPNPIILDQAGTCVMWGDGEYLRQVVYDMYGNLIWDYETGLVIDLIPGNLNVLGSAAIQQNLNVSGVTDVQSIYGELGQFVNLTGGTIISTGNMGVTGDLTVNGQTFLQGLATAGNVEINNGSSLYVDGDANFNQAVGVGTNLTVGNSLGVTGPTTLADTLAVASGATFDGDVTVGNNAQIDGNLTVNGTINSGGGGGGGQGQILVLATRVTNFLSGTDNVSTSDCQVIWAFGQANMGLALNVTVQLPNNPAVGFFFTWAIGLYGYSGSGTQQVNFLTASGGNIDAVGSTFTVGPAAIVGENYCFLHLGGNNWKMYLWSV